MLQKEEMVAGVYCCVNTYYIVLNRSQTYDLGTSFRFVIDYQGISLPLKYCHDLCV
jgi:hypothetical protein